MTGRRAGAGDLDQRVTIERRAPVDDGGGGRTAGWAEVARVWADVWPVGGSERAEAHQVQAAVMVRMRIRRREDVTADMRAVWRGLAHNILHIADGGRREPFLVLDCERGVAL